MMKIESTSINKMGVDYTVFHGYGYCVPVKLIPDNIYEELETIGITVHAQDQYGNTKSDAQMWIGYEADMTVLADYKIGFTPVSFIRTQQYPSPHLRGAASRYFAVKLDCWADKAAPDDLKKVLKRLGIEPGNNDYGHWLFSYFH